MSCLVRLHEEPVMMIDDIALGVGPIGAVLLQPNIQSDFDAHVRSSPASHFHTLTTVIGHVKFIRNYTVSQFLIIKFINFSFLGE